MHKPARADGVKTTLLPDGYVAVISSISGCAYTFPPMAALAWEFMDGEHSAEDIVEEVSQILGPEVDADELRKQIAQLVEELVENNFLVPDQSLSQAKNVTMG